jgi:hypothetical protein
MRGNKPSCHHLTGPRVGEHLSPEVDLVKVQLPDLDPLPPPPSPPTVPPVLLPVFAPGVVFYLSIGFVP